MIEVDLALLGKGKMKNHPVYRCKKCNTLFNHPLYLVDKPKCLMCGSKNVKKVDMDKMDELIRKEIDKNG